MHVTSYLVKLLVDHINLDGHGQAYPKRLLKLYISKTIVVSKLIFGPLPLVEKGSYKITIVSISVGQCISMSVGKEFFSKTAHRIFLKFYMKLDKFFGKNFILGMDNAQKYPKNRVFWILQNI